MAKTYKGFSSKEAYDRAKAASTYDVNQGAIPVGQPAVVGAPALPNPFQLMDLIPEGVGGALPGIFDVAGDINTFQSGEVARSVESMFPNLRPSLTQAGENIGSLLEGTIPADVAAQIQRQSAVRGLGVGGAGGTFGFRNLAGSLGLTSLGLQTQGQKQLESLTGNIRQNLTANPVDVMNWIPGISDVYNASANQALANAAELARRENLAFAQRGIATGASAGGGGGGGSVSVGMPNLSTRPAATPGDANFMNPFFDPSATYGWNAGGGSATPNFGSPGGFQAPNPDWASSAVYSPPPAPTSYYAPNYGGGQGAPFVGSGSEGTGEFDPFGSDFLGLGF